MPPDHEITPLCREMFKNINRQLDQLIQADKDRNGRYDEHLKESIEYRRKVDLHEQTLNELKALKRWLVTTIITVLFTLGAWLVTWGIFVHQVNTHDERLQVIESLHPRVNNILEEYKTGK